MPYTNCNWAWADNASSGSCVWTDNSIQYITTSPGSAATYVESYYVSAGNIVWSGINWQPLYASSVRADDADARNRFAEMERRAMEDVRLVQERHAAAEARAKKLLLSCLTPLQRQQLDVLGFFEVISRDSTNRYAIYSGRAGNVYRLDAAGKAVVKLCCHPAIDCPDSDTMLAQKFALEHDPSAFERTANSHPMDRRGIQHEHLRLARSSIRRECHEDPFQFSRRTSAPAPPAPSSPPDASRPNVQQSRRLEIPRYREIGGTGSRLSLAHPQA